MFIHSLARMLHMKLLDVDGPPVYGVPPSESDVVFHFLVAACSHCSMGLASYIINCIITAV